jgi:hypothetical protein
MAARVQIPASPLQTLEESTLQGIFYAVIQIPRMVLNCRKLRSTAYTTAYKFIFVLLTLGGRFYTV